MRTRLAQILRRLPLLGPVLREKDRFESERNRFESERNEALDGQERALNALQEIRRRQGFVEAGHFYSPIPDFSEAAGHAARKWASEDRQVPGIDMNESAQRELLESFVPYYRDLAFTALKTPGYRYYYDNPAYSYSDAIMLYCMIRHFRPSRVIEIGSGHSSCMTLDTNELYFENAIETTFIEPYPDLFESLIEPADRSRIRLIAEPLQSVSIEEFDRLQPGDFLFIDSTHVSKTGSDVVRIFGEILPRLASGVFIHFHDVFYPFEYPVEWIEQGRAWNEIYHLNAFLQFNSGFEIVLMNTFMHRFHHDFFEQNMPLCLENTGGSIWLRKR